MAHINENPYNHIFSKSPLEEDFSYQPGTYSPWLSLTAKSAENTEEEEERKVVNAENLISVFLGFTKFKLVCGSRS
jgi:hypothetical protein